MCWLPANVTIIYDRYLVVKSVFIFHRVFYGCLEQHFRTALSLITIVPLHIGPQWQFVLPLCIPGQGCTCNVSMGEQFRHVSCHLCRAQMQNRCFWWGGPFHICSGQLSICRSSRSKPISGTSYRAQVLYFERTPALFYLTFTVLSTTLWTLHPSHMYV